MLLKGNDAADPMLLAWTDMLGESFRQQWEERGWTAGYQSLVDEATGAVLFVHPLGVRQPSLIIDAQGGRAAR